MNKSIVNGFDALLACYGQQRWWPGDSPWEICAGAVLTQNTNWSNVEKAIALLKAAGALSPEAALDRPVAELEALLLPSGFFRIKARRLRNVAAWWVENVHGTKLKRELPATEWRTQLLAVNGVGPETADSILLYCFDLPVFVIDAYTRRLAARHFGVSQAISYSALQQIFTESLPRSPAMFNEYHALLVRNAKERCRKNLCSDNCPLRNI